MASSLTSPKFTATFSSSAALQTLFFSKNLPLSFSHPFLALPKTLTSIPNRYRRSLSHHHHHHSRGFVSATANSGNGADPSRHYDFDLFTIGAGSGGVRASRFASNFGASVAICELPFSTISSETTGGVGGT